MIRATNVTKRFGKVAAVDDLSFKLAKGEALALWGSNGAGKTTLIRCILGIIAFQGSVQIAGMNVRAHGKRARSLVGYVPQELSFHDDTRLMTAICFFARLRNAGPDSAASALDAVGLGGHERKRVRDLSGGMKQRLALAIALLTDPPIIMLDEPTSNLDSAGRFEVVQTLRRLRASGKTLVFASHRADEVVTLADRVLVMEQGQLIQDTTPSVLWPDAGPVRTIRLRVDSEREAHAAAVLREAGHTVNLNGHGLCVSVQCDQKAVPMSVLHGASIQVHDFELLDDVQLDQERRT